MTEDSKRMLVTIMFTDMVGYTALMQEHEALARQKRARHREVFEQTHSEFDGRIIQYFGDGTLSIFQNTLHAVQCAVELQLRLKEPIEVPLRVGLHLGEVLLEKDELIGDAVNVASRVESFAATGSILVSEAVVNQLRNQQHLSFRSMGLFHFKNVQRPRELFAVEHDRLVVPNPDELSGKGRKEAVLHNLPRRLNSFVGRQQEMVEIGNLVRTNPLVTLTGPGGSGKTSLSLKVAEQLQHDFRDGVRWISLSAVTDPDMVAYAVSEGLGLKPGVGDIHDVLIHFLADQEMLLLLDNFEQIVGASPLVAEMLINCPGIKILVTSRIVLNISGEREYPVEPLPLPEASDMNDLEVLRSNPAVDLFCQRAGQIRRKFELNPQNAGAVVEICLRLDGLPLALELAAARTKIFSPETLLQRLGKSLDVLKTRDRQMPERHQTLRQTIAWSYDLLDQEEQALLSRFSVFVGGSDLEAVEAICAQNGLSDWDFEEGIENLVDKSLIKVEETSSRFYMLETIREFASDQLRKSIEDKNYKKAHIQYYLQLAENASNSLSSGNEVSQESLTILQLELDNLKAAISYALELGALKLAYRLGLVLRPFWSNQGPVSEGIQLMKKIFSVPVEGSLTQDRIAFKQAFGIMHFYLGDFGGLEEIFTDCLNYWRDVGEERKAIEALNHLIFVQVNNGNLGEAEANYERIAGPADQLADPSFNMRILNNLGYLRFLQGRLDQAVAVLKQIIPIAKELGEERWVGYTYSNLSLPLIYKGAYQKALDGLLIAIKRHQEAQEITILQHALNQAGQVYFELGAYDKCEALIRETNEWNKVSHSGVSTILTTDTRARIALAEGRTEEAAAIIGQYLRAFFNMEPSIMWQIRAFRTKCHIAFVQERYDEVRRYALKLLLLDKSQTSVLTSTLAFEFSARLSAAGKDYNLSAKLFHKAQQLRAANGMPVPSSEKEIIRKLEEELSDQLGEGGFREAEAEVRHFTLQEAINLAHELLKD